VDATPPRRRGEMRARPPPPTAMALEESPR